MSNNEASFRKSTCNGTQNLRALTTSVWNEELSHVEQYKSDLQQSKTKHMRDDISSKVDSRIANYVNATLN